MSYIEINLKDLLVNTVSSAASDSLLGLATMNPELEIVDIGNVAMQKKLETMDKVLVISGGASGSEPAFGHYIGTGMLAAVVQGELTQSPASHPILQTIRELTAVSLRGILIIVNGNSGDLLNFGLAMERARKELLQVMMVSVTDDLNYKVAPCKRKGLSGIILVIKIAGAMAEDKQPLQKIHKFCQNIIENLISMPFTTKDLQWRNNCACEPHSGLITGENLDGKALLKQFNESHIQQLIETLIEQIINSEKITSECPLVLMINNVGNVTKLEELVVLKGTVAALNEKGYKISRVYSGRFLSSLYFDGLIFTVMQVTHPVVLKYLDYPTTALGWKNITETRGYVTIAKKRPSILRKIDAHIVEIKGPELKTGFRVKLETATNFACEAIISCERQLNIIDSKVGNGNTGTRLKAAAVLFLQKFRTNKAHFNLPYHFFQYLSKLCEYQLGGPLGCIFCILFEAIGTTFISLKELDDNLAGPFWLEALKNGVNSLKHYTLAQSGDNTILDPLEACIEGTVENLMEKPTYLAAFGCGVEAAENISMKLKKNDEFPDPGGHAIVIILRAVYESLKNS